MLTFARVGAYLVGVGGRDDQLWFRSITALAWEPLLHDDAPRYSVGWGRDLRSFGDWAHLTTSEGPDFGSVRSLRIEASDQGITTIEVDSDRGLHDPWASGRDADEVWTLEANELLHSTDRGATFVAAALPSWVSTPTHLMTAGDTLAFIAVTEESVALSLDRGETWDRVSIDVGASTSERWLGGMVDSRRALVLAGACGQVIVRPPHQAISGA